MGGICSKRATVDNVPSSSYSQNGCGNHGTALLNSHALPGKEHSSSTPLNGREDEDKQIREPFSFPELDSNTDGIVENSNGTYTDAIDDGIPRFSRVLSHKSRSTKSKQVAVAKVTELLRDVSLSSAVVWSCSTSGGSSAFIIPVKFEISFEWSRRMSYCCL